MSKTALDRLGKRLARAQRVDESDIEMLALVTQAYQDCLDHAERRLADLGFEATTRVKTTTTLLEKLRRESARLSQVHDLAGARIVVGDRVAQDKAVEAIATSFDGSGAASRVIDRRVKPSHGYRAVHVIAQVDRIPIEIQVRTTLQDAWAQLMERLADEWGRDIRYGDLPRDPEAVAAHSVWTRRQAVAK